MSKNRGETQRFNWLKVLVTKIDPDTKKISCSIKGLTENPWLNKIDKYTLLSEINFASPYIELPKKLTVKENLEIYARLYGIRNFEDRISQISKDLELNLFLNKTV